MLDMLRDLLKQTYIYYVILCVFIIVVAAIILAPSVKEHLRELEEGPKILQGK